MWPGEADENKGICTLFLLYAVFFVSVKKKFHLSGVYIKKIDAQVIWNFYDDVEGKRVRWGICSSCYNQLLSFEEVTKLRQQHQKQGLVPKGFGFGLTDETKRRQ